MRLARFYVVTSQSWLRLLPRPGWKILLMTALATSRLLSQVWDACWPFEWFSKTRNEVSQAAHCIQISGPLRVTKQARQHCDLTIRRSSTVVPWRELSWGLGKSLQRWKCNFKPGFLTPEDFGNYIPSLWFPTLIEILRVWVKFSKTSVCLHLKFL